MISLLGCKRKDVLPFIIKRRTCTPLGCLHAARVWWHRQQWAGSLLARGGLLDAHLNSTVRVGASTMMPYGLDEKFSSENAVSNTQAKSLHGLVWTKETDKPQNLLLSVCLVAVSDS